LFSVAAAAALLVALVSLAPSLHAQQQEPNWVRCDTCWRYFDSSQSRFLIGVVDMKFPLLARELGIDFTKLYGLPNPSQLWQVIQNPGAATNNPVYRLLDTLTRNLWLGADTTGYRVVSRFPNTSEVIYATRRLETYIWDNQWPQMIHPMWRFFGNHDWSYFASVPVENRDTVMHGMVYAATMRDTSVHTPQLVGAGVRYTADEVFHLGNRHLYKVIGSPERTTMFRVSVAMKVAKDTAAQHQFDTLSDTTELARIVVYRRARQGQIVASAPKAWIFEPFDTVVIRKSTYLDSNARIVEDGYRELGKTIDMKRAQQVRLRDTVVFHTWVRAPGDTVRGYVEEGDDHPDQYARPFPDTVPWLIYNVRHDTIHTYFPGGPGTFARYDTVARYDTIYDLHIPLYVAGGDDYLFGRQSTLFAAANASSTQADSLLATGIFAPGAIVEAFPPEASDFNMKIYSTRRIPLSFLRWNINQDLYDSMRAGRLDAYLRSDIDSLAQTDSLIMRVLDRIATGEEPTHARLRSEGYVSRTLQNALRANGDSTRQLYHNFSSNFDGYRLLSEDYDHIGQKTQQLFARQDYVTIGSFGSVIPLFYANIDSMDTMVFTRWYRPTSHDTLIIDSAHCPVFAREGDTLTDRNIAFNTLPDYIRYTAQRQCALGSFHDADNAVLGQTDGPFVRQTARAVNVAKFRYAPLGPPSPVWVHIEPRGWVNPTGAPRSEPGGWWNNYWSLFRPPTPEEVTIQAWLALNCGADGIVYSDGGWDGVQFGFFNNFLGKSEQEYDTLRDPNHARWSEDTLKHTFPKMWIGFRSRFDAIKKVNHTIRRLDTILHLEQLRFNRQQISMFDPADNLSRLPMLAEVRTGLARRYDTSTGGKFKDSVTISGSDTDKVYDAPTATYLEVTQWSPGPYNAADQRIDARYLLLTNRRLWPVDWKHYGSAARSKGADSVGLGAIDVRRPVITLNNISSIMADSMMVEKVLDPTWHRTVAVGTPVELDWLVPGWGEMYRVVPVPSGVSQFGTAYNNAIRSENPSYDNIQCDRILTYERDSIVFLRTLDPTGKWSREVMISSPNDTLPGQKAWNLHPAVAVTRDEAACLVVWERKNASNNQSTVESALFPQLPNSTTLADDALTDQVGYLRLSTPRTLSQSWMQQTPSVVGLEYGWLISWATPGSGIELKALRNNNPPNTNDTSLTARIFATSADIGFSLDSTCEYPTLAYVRNRSAVDTSISYTFYDTTQHNRPYVVGDGNNIVHLAWQQGIPAGSYTRYIMYNKVGVDLGAITNLPRPRLIVYRPVEHVTRGLNACAFLHPSIAADSARVGVSFEIWTWSHRLIALRFRDTIIAPTTTVQPWRTTVYKWGGFDWYGWMHSPTNPFPAFPLYYERPSLTEFPSYGRSASLSSAQGDLVWHFTNKPIRSELFLSPGPIEGRKDLLLYRFGWLQREILGIGQDPTMSLVPLVANQPWERSSVFHRGDTIERISRQRPHDTTHAWYYPGVLINTPTSPSVLLTKRVTGSGIHSGYQLRARTLLSDTTCAQTFRDPVIDHRLVVPIDGPVDFHGIGIFGPITPGLPPSFFAAPGAGQPLIDSASDVVKVARTSVFTTTSTPVVVRRFIGVSDSVLPWLDASPYDSALGQPANVMMVMEVVRDSDGVVLWQGDTMSARGMAGDALEEDITVPTDTIAPGGTEVFIRLRAGTTAGLDYEVEAGFHFVEDYEDSLLFKKIPQRGSNGDSTISGSMSVGMSILVEVIPNPLKGGTGELRVFTAVPGEIRIRVMDILGNERMRLSPFDAQAAGTYGMGIDLSGMANGVYTILVEQGERRASTQVSVQR
jgi:hypothetical protein